jgi:molybdopterin-guanine dinucleotide biosynthesis protein A
MSSSGSINGLTLVIVAGGGSRRMGQDKAFLPLNGKPLIQHVIDNLALLRADETLVITRTPERYTHLPLTTCRDLIPDCGPLGGLYTALTLAQHEHIAIVGCDIPFASAVLFGRLCTLLTTTPADAAVPRRHDQREPLHAIYERRALPVVEQQLGREDYSMMALLDKLNVTYFDTDNGLPFINVNSPNDFAQAAARLAACEA